MLESQISQTQQSPQNKTIQDHEKLEVEKQKYEIIIHTVRYCLFCFLNHFLRPP